ncbi:plasma membrane calcium [Coniosporium apollinis]|uniref:Calcium-transporting ATPase n=2 Tax=Coniosporium TaxID=2810619 RepID=A0ABQ9P5J4_9PEZI|nr:plasma membrane calcium [Cladosporium sp. JES 115]KAJ9669583.1 plasma membrane calcium [Coniosporium apollinis]
MADAPGPDGLRSTSPGPTRRARAPTITIDTSAVNSPVMDDDHTASQPQSQLSPTEARTANSLDSRDERPTSPHNVSSPTSGFGNGQQSFLAVPGSHSRVSSVDSSSENSQSTTSAGDTYINTPSPISPANKPKGPAGHSEILSDEDALKPDPGTESYFQVEDNKFAFSPGQLSKLFNPKSLGAFHALGGLAGLEKGLQTDRKTGLSVDERHIDRYVSFAEATGAASAGVTNGHIAEKPEKSGTTASEPHKQSSDAFADRKRVFSDNRLPERKPKSIWELAWIAYNDKVLLLLTAAAVISLALGLYQTFGQTHEPGEAQVEWVEGVAIMVAIIIVVVVGAVNDWQKERQFVKLNKKKENRTIKVIRSGRTQEISVYDVLVGDVCLLEPGDMVPVDGIFIDGHNVKCDESSATGESDLLKKTPADEVYRAMEAHEDVKKLDPFIISGAKVAEGVGSFLVTATGINSSFGKTMMALREDSEVTPLQAKLNLLAEYIAKLGGSAALLLFVVLLIQFLAHLPNNDATPSEKGQNFLRILIVAITVVVVAVPEGLPLAVTLALAFATTRMLKDNNLVRLLRSCETMGNATTICSDKTGTLTQNKMTVVAGALGTVLRFGARKPRAENEEINGKSTASNSQDSIDDMSPGDFANTLSPDVRFLLEQSIAINSTAFEGEEDGKPAFIGSKTETALLNFARQNLGMGPVSVERSNANIVQLVPFDSGRKCMAAIVKLENGKYRMYVKGASEIVLGRCSTIIADPTRDVSARPMSPEDREILNGLITSYATRSLRTIGCAYRDFEQWPPRGAKTMEDEATMVDFDSVFKDLTFLGVVGIQDPLRDGVPKAVKDCQRAGVFVRMVTGDNVLTAKAIAEDCGILVPGGLVMEGPTFRKLSKREMDQVIPKLCVLARSSPEDKRILVRRLKELGETVAVTGDGTNDAPALKAADVGFSMGIAGTEVAKEASAIILMDDNFASIVKALLWGRAVNDAVKKFLQFQITVNITAVFLTFISAVASSDQSSVLTAVQLLWVNLIMDTFAALALATDPPTPSLLNRKPDPKSAPLITLNMWKMIIGQAIYQLVITFILHFAGARILSYDTPEELEQMDTLVFNTFVWMQIFNQINNRRLDNKYNIFEGIQHNYFFIFINCIMIGGQVMIIFVGGRAFSVVKLGGAQWGISIILGSLSIPVGVIIRTIPDDLIRRFIPDRLRPKPKPDVAVSDDMHWADGVNEIREELAFIRKIRGGRLSSLKFKIQHPRTAFGHSHSTLSVPSTPVPEDGPTAPVTPEARTRKRGRSRSNSAFGPAAAMAGIIAGSVAGGLSPIGGQGGSDNDSLKFSRNLNRSELERVPGIDVHPETNPRDPVLVQEPLRQGVAPSQSVETTPNFNVGPYVGEPRMEQPKEKDDTRP